MKGTNTHAPLNAVHPEAHASGHTPWARVVLFFLILIVPLAAGEIYLRSLPNPYKTKHAYLQAHSREVETLILGSSHAYYGIHPETFGPHAFSAAMVSQTLRYDDYLLHHYDFTNLRIVIEPISDFSLYEEIENGKEWYLATYYRLYMDCDIHPRFGVYGYEVTSFRTYCENLKRLWQPSKIRWSASGQGLDYTVENKQADWDNAEWRAATNRYTDFSHAPHCIRYLQNMADFCHKQGAELILVSTPLRPSYRKLQNPEQIENMEQHINAFLKKNPEVRYMDFRADPRFTANDFYDADHLSQDGALKLSELIKAHITPCQ